MYQLNTYFSTLVRDGYLIDPSIMKYLIKKSNKKRDVTLYDYTDINDPYRSFIRDICSGFLFMNHISHNKDRWYMDIIRYQLDNDEKRVKSGLAWHCENDNYPDVISVLLYLKIDDTIIDGNLQYKDKDNNKQILNIKSGMTVIMDGRVPHKPQDPYGSGMRELIIVSFEIN